MSESDRVRWDDRYRDQGMAPSGEFGPPPVFAPFEHLLPSDGLALELACGRGRAAVWLANRGLQYLGVDVSPVAVDLARQLVEREHVADRYRFEVHDLDDGLPEGDPVDLLFVYKFFDRSLAPAMIKRLKPGGVLATAVLSEVGHGPGRFRVVPGELLDAFSDLDVLEHGEAEGMAWLIGNRV